MYKTKAIATALALAAFGIASAAYAQRLKLEAAQRDPFGAVVALVPKQMLAPPKPIAPAPPPAPLVAPAPTAPDLGLQYAGQMTAPTGERQVFAMHQNNLLTLQVGTALPNGYVVQAIEPRVVRFTYPSLNTTARLQLPELPKFESR